MYNSASKETYPKPKSYIHFDKNKAAKYSSTIDVFGFADFECKLSRLEKKNRCTYCNQHCCSCTKKKKLLCKNICHNCERKNDESFTFKKEVHVIISYSIIFVDKYGKILFEKCYCGDNPGEHFSNI